MFSLRVICFLLIILVASIPSAVSASPILQGNVQSKKQILVTIENASTVFEAGKNLVELISASITTVQQLANLVNGTGKDALAVDINGKLTPYRLKERNLTVLTNNVDPLHYETIVTTRTTPNGEVVTTVQFRIRSFEEKASGVWVNSSGVLTITTKGTCTLTSKSGISMTCTITDRRLTPKQGYIGVLELKANSTSATKFAHLTDYSTLILYDNNGNRSTFRRA